jgi:hypothetical protein
MLDRTRLSLRMLCVLLVAALLAPIAGGTGVVGQSPAPMASVQADNPNPPASTVKLIFIHHSTGENWLADDNGRLGLALRDNNYFVSDTNYGWGSDGIGDLTDIGHWWLWFVGPRRDVYTTELYREYRQNCLYARLPHDPGGENQIVMFKSCFPNSQVEGNPNDPPTAGDNPLRGQGVGDTLTVGNAKGIYNDLLTYFRTRQDKLFIVITAPPQVQNPMVTDAEHAANARALNSWLVHDWLAGYPYRNVAVFDFFNILTSNGGNPNAHDLGWATGNHHRWRNGAVEHVQSVANNFSAYASSSEDSHPTAAGGQKASGEFVQLLNVFYHCWAGTSPTATPLTPGPTASRTPTRTRTPTSTRTSTPTRIGTATRTRTSGPTPTQGYCIAYLPIILKNWSQNQPWPSATPGLNGVVIQRGTSGDVADAYVWESSPTYTGNWETLYTGCVGWGRKRTLLRFDLSSLGPGVSVHSATLAIYLKSETGGRSVNAHRVLVDWGEDSVTWNSLGSDYEADPSGSFTADSAGWREVDVTDLARGWLDGSIPNQGVLLDDPAAGTDENEEYYSSEWSEVEQRPKLVLVVGGE